MADETAGTSTSHADLYFFGCGHDYKACLQDFVTLSGPVPIPPLATFGVWWSHYETYSEQTIKTDVLDKFLQHELPLNVLQVREGEFIVILSGQGVRRHRGGRPQPY